MKRKTPYDHLMEEFKEFHDSVKFAHKVLMWTYPKDELEKGWVLIKLFERIQAAEQLDYKVILEKADDGLRVYYRKKPEFSPRF
jgi:hypothetical protein